MKSLAAYTSKLKAELQGKTQKVQNDSRSLTTGFYRGVPACGPLNYTELVYPVKSQICCYTNNDNNTGNIIINPPVVAVSYDAGFLEPIITSIFDGKFSEPVSEILDGGV